MTLAKVLPTFSPWCGLLGLAHVQLCSRLGVPMVFHRTFNGKAPVTSSVINKISKRSAASGSTSVIARHPVILSQLACQSQQLSPVHLSAPCHVLEDRTTKALTVWSNLKQLRTSPLPAVSFGTLGLVPFVGVPAYLLTQQYFCADLAFAQVAYGACVLSFLGGVRWGFTLPEENPIQPDWKNLGYSVMPCLVAWPALLLPHPLSLFTLMSGLTLAAYFDMAMYGYPPWFKGMRFALSFVAVLALWTTFMCSLMLPDVKNKALPDVKNKAQKI